MNYLNTQFHKREYTFSVETYFYHLYAYYFYHYGDFIFLSYILILRLNYLLFYLYFRARDTSTVSDIFAKILSYIYIFVEHITLRMVCENSRTEF